MAISSLDRSTSASAFSVVDLLAMAREGRVRVPNFQRKFRWKAPDVLRLFDSLMKDYPIGTLLFWKHEAPATTLRFGDWSAEAPERDDAFWVVDGQQRLHSIVATLLANPDLYSRGSAFALAYDLELRRVRHVRESLGEPHFVPLAVLADSSRLVEWLFQARQRGLPAALHQVAIAACTRLREYRIPAYVVVDDFDTARDIFVRLNTSGQGMKADEVLHALQASLSEGDPAAARDLSGRLEDTGFGPLSPRLLTAAVAMANDLDPVERRDRQLPALELAVALPRAETAIRRTIQFLQADAGIPHASLVPYQFVFSLLVRFFARHPAPHPRTRQLLARVVWRGIVGGTLKGSSAADVGRLWRACAEAEAPAIEALIEGTRISALEVPWGPWSLRSAPTRTLICALLGGAIPAGCREVEAFCLALGRSEEPGSWVLHAPMASPAAELAQDPGLAQSLGFAAIDLSALELGRLDEVIQRRNRWMRERLAEFLTARCALRLPDAPAMETLRGAWSTTP